MSPPCRSCRAGHVSRARLPRLEPPHFGTWRARGNERGVESELACEDGTVRRAGLWAGLAYVCAIAAGCGGIKGEDPEPVVEVLRREPALGVAPPGAGRDGEVEDHAGSGDAEAVQRYINCSAKETAVQYFTTALAPLGWRRVEARQLWMKRIGDREAILELEYPRLDRAHCRVRISAYYETKLIGG